MLRLYFVIYLTTYSMNVFAHGIKTYHYHYEDILFISFLVLTIFVKSYKEKRSVIITTSKKNYIYSECMDPSNVDVIEVKTPSI